MDFIAVICICLLELILIIKNCNQETVLLRYLLCLDADYEVSSVLWQNRLKRAHLSFLTCGFATIGICGSASIDVLYFFYIGLK